VLEIGDVFLKRPYEARVDLDCGDRCAGIGQRQCECTESGADLKHMVALANMCQGGDSTNRLGLDHEVLAECTSRRESVAFEHRRGL